MGKSSTAKSHGPPPLKRRKSLPQEQQKKEKGRSRNACDRCKQKKVKCDGEGVTTCTICMEGDFHCHYAQKAHSEKNQYRKGYVEMVEEANEYYKSGIHRMYDLFKDASIFKDLRTKYGDKGKPTAQEIISSSGIPSTDKPYERGLENVDQYLVEQGKPILTRKGEWDRVQLSQSNNSSPGSSVVSSPASSPRTEQHMIASPIDNPRTSSFSASGPNSPTTLQTFSRKSSGVSLANSTRNSVSSSTPRVSRNERKSTKQYSSAVNPFAFTMPDTSSVPMETSLPASMSRIVGKSAVPSTTSQGPLNPLQRSPQRSNLSPSYSSPAPNQQVRTPTTSSMDSNSGTVCLADLDLNQHPVSKMSNSMIPSTSATVMESQLFYADPFPSIAMGEMELETIWMDPFRGSQSVYGIQEAGI